MGYIYLLECVSDDSTSYKIGFTKNKDISKRVSSLQTGNKDKIKCVDVFKTNHDRKIETSLHNQFKYCKLEGEWFDLNIRDIANFKSTCDRLEKNFDILKNNNPFYT
jgi:hypothetical protein